MQDLARVCETSTNVVMLERWVAVEDLPFGPARRQEINDQLDGDPPTFNNWFHKDLRVHRGVVTPGRKSSGRSSVQVLPPSRLRASTCSAGRE